MEPSEALAKIRTALVAVTQWGGDPEPWPEAAILEAYWAVVALAKHHAEIGTASERGPRRITAANVMMLSNIKLDFLAEQAKTDPDARLRLVAELGVIEAELVAPAADIGADRSRRQQEIAGESRYKDETNAQLNTAREIHRESEDRGGPYFAQFDTAARVAKEVGRRLYGEDESAWPCPRRRIEDRLREYPKRWKRDAQPADAEPG